MNLDDLELELRKLPGVRSVGFDQRDELVLVQVHVVTAPGGETPLPIAATRIAARHSDRPVAVEIVRSSIPPSTAVALHAVPEAAPEAATEAATGAAPITVAPAVGAEPEPSVGPAVDSETSPDESVTEGADAEPPALTDDPEATTPLLAPERPPELELVSPWVPEPIAEFVPIPTALVEAATPPMAGVASLIPTGEPEIDEPEIDEPVDPPIDEARMAGVSALIPTVETAADVADIEVTAQSQGTDAHGWPSREDREARPRLLAVLSFPDTNEIEVHLIRRDQRVIGRAPSAQGVDAAAEATMQALRDLDIPIDAQLRWARPMDQGDASTGTGSILVAVALDGSPSDPRPLYGFASGATELEAASRATLDALNRTIQRVTAE